MPHPPPVLSAGFLESRGDPDWGGYITARDGDTIFQTSHWAKVLHHTYGHRPFAWHEPSDGLADLFIPIMEVSSRWTGHRAVSLPFTDFCPAIITQRAFAALQDRGRQRGWKYFETRNGELRVPGATSSVEFYGHVIQLLEDGGRLLRGFESSVRRGIRKAQEAGLSIRFETSLESVRDFYALHCLTRKRHGVPPQPFRFFRNIQTFVLEPGYGFVANCRVGERVIASAIFLHFGTEAVYKFGASDLGFQHLRPNNLLMWESFKRCASLGCRRAHLGRTSLGQEGLRRFKRAFGAQEVPIRYFRYDLKSERFVRTADRARSRATAMFKVLPVPLLRLIGAALYPHVS